MSRVICPSCGYANSTSRITCKQCRHNLKDLLAREDEAQAVEAARVLTIAGTHH